MSAVDRAALDLNAIEARADAATGFAQQIPAIRAEWDANEVLFHEDLLAAICEEGDRQDISFLLRSHADVLDLLAEVQRLRTELAAANRLTPSAGGAR